MYDVERDVLASRTKEAIHYTPPNLLHFFRSIRVRLGVQNPTYHYKDMGFKSWVSRHDLERRRCCNINIVH
jgi:hypothetical protein